VVFGLLIAQLALADCGSPSTLIADVEQAVFEARLSEAERLIQEAERAFGCSGLADPELLGRMWLAEGVMFSLRGQATDAEESWLAASRAAPGFFVEDYGEQIQAKYRQAAALQRASGEIAVSPIPDGYETAIDGVFTVVPGQIPRGLHLIQVGPRDGDMAFAQVVLLTAGVLDVRTGLGHVAADIEVTADGPTLELPTELDTPKRRAPILLIGAASAATLAVTSAAVTYGQTGVMRNAENFGDLDAAHARQQAFGVTTVVLSGVAATGFTLHFAL
jgi:hypothetical protein